MNKKCKCGKQADVSFRGFFYCELCWERFWGIKPKPLIIPATTPTLSKSQRRRARRKRNKKA